MTIDEATKAGPAIVMIGENRTHSIGSTAYRVSPNTKPTRPPYCRCYPVMWMDGQWQGLQSQPLNKPWDAAVTVIEELTAAYIQD